MLVDLRNKNITGREAENILYQAGIIVNRNSVPDDPRSPFDPSGIRLGTPAITARGFKEWEMKKIAGWIREAIEKQTITKKVREEVLKLIRNFPIKI